MAGYITRRFLGMILLLFLLTLTVFFLFNMLPADPARLSCGKACSPQIVENNRHRLELDIPPIEQYQRFISGLFFGRTYLADTKRPIECEAPCLGYSFLRNSDVLSLITRSVPATFWLAVGGFVVWMAIGLTFGIISALKRGKWQDRTIMGIALLGYSLPSFFIGLVLLFTVVLWLHLLPSPQWVDPFKDPVRFLQTMILPWITIAILNAAFYMRLTRNQVLEVFGDDYIRTARAKGLPERTVVVKHALRAGLTPIVTAAGLDLAYLLGGAIITENIYSLPGLGSLAVNSVIASDLPIITAITLITAAIIIVANLVVDLLYAVIDPRVRIS
ncbi:MAG TPA: ABC transporter permease [Candidatus Binatia bacterium]|nr:ABC transporter permease [Candidatus Binatia bacterium]